MTPTRTRPRAPWAAGFCVGMATLLGCAAPDTAESPVTQQDSAASVSAGPRSLGPDAFATAISDPDRFIINVHIPYEGEIADTDLQLPYNEIGQLSGLLPADRSTPLAVYCRSGPMSQTAMDTLSGLGYTDIVELDGVCAPGPPAGET